MAPAARLTEKSSWFEIVMNNWVGRALQIAIGALLITAMGGAMGGILRENEAIATIGGMIAESSFPAVLVPFLMAAILMTVCGSMTTAAMTAAGLMGGLMTVLGLDPVLTTLAIGAGSMVGWHVNNSGFWIFTSLYGFDTKQGLKYFTTTNALGGIVAFIVLVILTLWALSKASFAHIKYHGRYRNLLWNSLVKKCVGLLPSWTRCVWVPAGRRMNFPSLRSS